jgi:hypothetical protein
MIRVDFGRLDPDPHSGSRRAKCPSKVEKREEILSFEVVDVLF